MIRNPAQPATESSDDAPPRAMEAVMEAFLDGDVRSFDELFRHFSPRILRFLRFMGAERSVAEDLTQATFFKIHRARASYRRGSPLEPWIFAIARHTFLDHRRQIKRKREMLSDDGALPEVGSEPIDAGENRDRLDDAQTIALHARLNSLPDAQREALVLLKVEGLSTAEAAAVTGSTPGAIKLRAHRAYESLRKALGIKVKS